MISIKKQAGALALALALLAGTPVKAQQGGFYEGRRVRTVTPRAEPTPAPTPTPAPAVADLTRTANAAAAPVEPAAVAPQTAAPEAPAAAPSTASRLGFSPGRTAGYVLGAAGGGLAAAWPLASRLGMRAGGRFALGVLGASAGLMAANWLIDRVAGRSEFDLMGPVSRRTTGYLAGAIGGGALLAGPVGNLIARVAGITGPSRLMTMGRFGLAALGVGAGLLAANWLMNRYVQWKADRQIREHDRRWQEQDENLDREWEGSGGYLENEILEVPMGGARTDARAPAAPAAPGGDDPLNAGEQLRISSR